MSESTLAELEARVASLEALMDAVLRDRAASDSAGVRPSGAAEKSAVGSQPAGTFALLETLEEHTPGAVAVVGSVQGEGGPLRWQYALPQETLAEGDWTEAAGRLAALGNPARLIVLQAALARPRRTSELVDELRFDSLGQLNHHIRVLTAAGWLQAVGRGEVQVPPPRVIPLLAVLVAMN